MNTDVHLQQYLAEFFLKPEMFQTKFEKKIKTKDLYLLTIFLKSCLL